MNKPHEGLFFLLLKQIGIAMTLNISGTNVKEPALDDVESGHDDAPHNPVQSGVPKKTSGQSKTSSRQAGVRNSRAGAKAPSTGQQLKMRAVASPSDSKVISTPTTDSEHSWETSGPYINGSVEFDMVDQDKRDVEAKKKAADEAQKKAEEAEKESKQHGPPYGTNMQHPDQAKAEAKRAQKEYEDANNKLQAKTEKHLAAMTPYTAGKLGLDNNNHLTRNEAAGKANWVVSATESRNVIDEAAKHAKNKIDADLAKAWEEQVNDIRAWREKNKGNLSSEDIDRHIYEASEAYLLLKQNAEQKKKSIDDQASAFKEKLDENEAAVTKEVQENGSKDQKKLLDSMNERSTNLESTIADMNDQCNEFATLSGKTVNSMRVGTDPAAVPPFVSEQSGKQDERDATSAETQKHIDSTVDQIKRSSSKIGQAEQAARFNEMPKNATTHDIKKINKEYETTQLEMAKELRNATKRIHASFQTLEEDSTKLGKWSIPGKAKLPSVLGALGLGKTVLDFGEQLNDYIEKSNNGTLTAEDKQKMFDASRSLVGAITPYIPVVGPVLEPFVIGINAFIDLAEANKHSPVQNVAATMQSETAKGVGGYPPIAPPTA